MDRTPHILMCPPDYYGIHYEINPWMNCERNADHETAVRQWHALVELIEQCGVRVSRMPPVEGLPDLVFTANAALIYRKQAILSRFRHPQRQGETSHDEAWLAANGFEVLHVPRDFSFEGAGDALFSGDTLLAGYRIRSDAGVYQLIAEMIGQRVIPLELVDPFHYHLDTCFCPISPTEAIYYPPAFDDYGRRALEEAVEVLIPVSQAEARRFACNAVVVGRTVITNTGCEALHADLSQRGYTALATPLDEFVKAGGSAKCLTLRLDGEDAAGWKTA